MDHDELCTAIALDPARFAATLAANAPTVSLAAPVSSLGKPKFAAARIAAPCFRGLVPEGFHDLVLTYTFDPSPTAVRTSVAIEVEDEVTGNVLEVFERLQLLSSARREHRYVVVSLAESDESLRPLFESQGFGLIIVVD